MSGCTGLKRAGAFFVLTVLLLTMGLPLAAGLLPGPVSAQNAVAISGNFYTQKFVIPVGGHVDVASIYVVAFNQGTEAAAFTVSYTASAPDVTLVLSEEQFVLDPAQSRRVQVGVYVGANATPGIHEITVSVKAERETSEGVVLVLGSAEQKASLSIVGEAGSVHVESKGPGGNRIMTHIRLWKIVDGDQYEVAESHNGLLDVIVSPGSYVVKAYSMGVELASQELQVAHLGQLDITLSVETIYFKYFEPALARNVNTGAPGYAQIVYTIANVYEPVSNAAVNLVVKFEGADLEMIPGILTLSALNTGDTGVPYQYFPSAGWENGAYSFQLELYLGGQLYARSEEKPLDVSVPGSRYSSWLWILLGVVGAAGLGLFIFFLWKRRRKEEEKPRREKKPKRKPEPAPAPAPVRQPQPAAPPQPVQTSEPMQPARPVKPAEPLRRAAPPPVEAPPAPQPEPLTSISSLKARMASMGRDQGTGQDTDEEGETEGQEAPAPPDEPQASVTASDTRMPHRPPDAQGPPPVRPEPAEAPEMAEAPEAAETPEAVQPPPPPDGLADLAWQSIEPGRDPGVSDETASAGAAVTEEPETEAAGPPPPPPSRIGFAEAARLRREARQRASQVDKAGGPADKSPAEGDGAGGTGGGDESPPPD